MILHRQRRPLYLYCPQSRDGQLLPVAAKALKLFITYNLSCPVPLSTAFLLFSAIFCIWIFSWIFVLYKLQRPVPFSIVLSKGITTFPHFISPMPLDVLVTKHNCASNTPMTSAMRELSVFACFKSATIMRFCMLSIITSIVIGDNSVPKSRIPYTVKRLSTSTFVQWLKIFNMRWAKYDALMEEYRRLQKEYETKYNESLMKAFGRISKLLGQRY